MDMTLEHKIAIGSLMTYVGAEWEAAWGEPVRVCYVLRGRGRPDDDPDEERYLDEDRLVRDNETLESLGGVTRDDLVDVVFVRPDGSASNTHTNVRLGELVPCADPTIRPNRNRPMRVKDLRAVLAGCDPNACVLIGGERFEFAIRGIATREECEDVRLGTDNSIKPNDLLLVPDGESLRVLPENAWTAARRR